MRLSTRLASACVVAALGIGLAASRPAAQAGPYDALVPGQWMELPGTKIRSVLPSPLPQGSPDAIILAWGGAAADTSRNRLIVWGGGHNDYYGNELYALDLTTKAMRRLTDPSPIGSASRCLGTLPDGNPASRHTYGNLVYMPHVDRMFAFGGAHACINGGFVNDTWTFDFSTNRWHLMNPAGPLPVYGVTASAYDPVTQKVFIHDTYGFSSYDFATNRYTRHIADFSTDYHLTAAIDPARRKFVLLGDGVQVIDLDTFATSRLATTNAPAFVTSRQSPGIAFDPVANRIVAWHGGNSVYALDLATAAWTQVAAGIGPNVPAPQQGTYGRWSYFPQYGVFALVNSIDQNAFVFRVGPAGAPGTTVPAAPTNLRVP